MATESEHDAKRRRWPLLLLAVGAVVAAMVFLNTSPAEHTVELRLANPGNIRGLQLSWRDENGELLRSRHLRFGKSGAPRRIDASLTAPSGQIRLEVAVERDGAGTRVHRRRLRLKRGQGATVVPIAE